MMQRNTIPLSGPPPSEVHLGKAPLVKVLAQARFPERIKIREEKELGEFQDRLHSMYPLFERIVSTGHALNIELGGVRVEESQAKHFRFKDENNIWRVTLSHDFVSLETKLYTSRKDFTERLSFIFRAVEEIYEPRICTRLGVRYVDQMTGSAFAEINDFMQPGILGLFGSIDLQKIRHGVTELGFEAEEGHLNLRFGLLPANATFDPNIIDPIGEASWTLDLDLFAEGHFAFKYDGLSEKANKSAARIYSVFRWMVTDRFLRYYGDDK